MAILCPPIAVLMCGRWVQAIVLSLPLTAAYWVPGIIHALIVVHISATTKRQEHDLLMAAARSTIAANVRK